MDESFIDAGEWLSILIQGDRFHPEGTLYFRHLLQLHALLIITDYVLDEVITRIRYDVSHLLALQFIRLFREAEDNGILQILPVSEEMRRRAEEIFGQYKDTKLSFTDCTSFAVLETFPTDGVFGFDGHFEMMGHVLQPKQ